MALRVLKAVILVGAVCLLKTAYSAEVSKNSNLRGADNVNEKSWVWTDDHPSETPTIIPTINNWNPKCDTSNPTKKSCDTIVPTASPTIHTDSPR